MNQKEQARISVLSSVLEYQVPIVQAAEVLGVSSRHARRLLAAYRQDGAAALAHGNRGRRPHNAIAPAEAAAVVELAAHRYEGANHTHLTELLREREGIDLSRPTVRRILTKAGIGSPRSRRSPQHRFRRQRMPQAGMLLQLDGSHHAWLEDRGPKFALLLAVDDATSAVVNAVFCISENTAGYFTLLAVIQQAYVKGVSTRRVDDLIKSLGCDGISKSQVSRICRDLDQVVENFLGRPLGSSPYPYVWLDALTQKVREGGRIVNVSVVVATGVNAQGQREILGMDVGTSEDGAF